MQQDLVVAKSLNDINGECRAHGNLGAAYFSQGNYKEALTSHRYQLVLAMKCKETQAAASALTRFVSVFLFVAKLYLKPIYLYLGSIKHKHNIRWQHLSRIKASKILFLIKQYRL